MYQIKSRDERNWIIFSEKIMDERNPITGKKNKHAGELTEVVEGFYPTLETACLALLDKELRVDFNPEKILKAIKKARKKVIEEFDKNKKACKL